MVIEGAPTKHPSMEPFQILAGYLGQPIDVFAPPAILVLQCDEVVRDLHILIRPKSGVIPISSMFFLPVRDSILKKR
jgi:hypothetical protein